MKLWQWQELESALELVDSTADSALSSIDGICIDSRACQAGDLFVALAGDPGPRFNTSSVSQRDGHEFVAAAVQRGAAAVLISDLACLQDAENQGLQIPYLKVDNTLDGLWQLGKFARQRTVGRVAAITGSAGKTTARGWLEQLLAEQAQTHASTGSLNNHWGVPLSLSRMPKEAEYAVFEIGTSHPGEIAPLAKLVSPHVALILNVLPAHIGNFENLAAIRDEKLSIIEALSGDGIVVLPYDLRRAAQQRFPDVTIVSFGFEVDADVSALAEYHADGATVAASISGVSVKYELKVAGEHRVLTSLAVLAVAHHLGANVQAAAAGFVALSAPVGRGNEINIGGIKIIDDSYNANPVSMSYAISALNESPVAGRRIACLGEMLELGSGSAKAHESIIAQTGNLDRLITVGQGFAHCTPEPVHESKRKARHIEDVAELDVAAFAGLLEVGDTVLVKGSNKVFWQQDFVKRLVQCLSDAE